MTTVPLSLRIEAEIKKKIEQEAKLLDRSTSYVVVQAINDYLDSRRMKRQAIENALVEAEKGVFISEKAMGEWLDSWGTDAELPPPDADIFSGKQS